MELQGKKIALVATDGFEDVELTGPKEAVEAAGAEVDVISLEAGTISGKNDTEITVKVVIDDADEADYDGILLPGGVENPDKLRLNEDVIDFIKSFGAAGKPIAAICHAPWLLIEAELVDGKKVTSWPSLRKDLENAGAMWVDEQVVTDNGLVTSRNPDDVPAFSKKAIEEFAEGIHK